ncbi:hypothetical protein LCGC14_1126780 [marine sediment metagenome]|uniref:Uncharacterized protein n=1 Tax=marine sediment metagenome TaxID=412755 RepID=A0A0F9M2C7_9ZZZZ
MALTLAEYAKMGYSAEDREKIVDAFTVKVAFFRQSDWKEIIEVCNPKRSELVS